MYALKQKNTEDRNYIHIYIYINVRLYINVFTHWRNWILLKYLELKKSAFLLELGWSMKETEKMISTVQFCNVSKGYIYISYHIYYMIIIIQYVISTHILYTYVIVYICVCIYNNLHMFITLMQLPLNWCVKRRSHMAKRLVKVSSRHDGASNTDHTMKQDQCTPLPHVVRNSKQKRKPNERQRWHRCWSDHVKVKCTFI